MTLYAGIDVSDKTTHVCVVDGDGAVIRRDVVASDPDVLAKWLKRHVPGLARVVLETGPLSTFLYHGLVERDVKSVTVHYFSFPWGGLNNTLSPISPNDMIQKLSDAFKSGKDMAEARKSTRGKGSWLQKIADSMATVLDAKIQDMDKQAQALDKQGSNKSVKASTNLQVAGQEFS